MEGGFAYAIGVPLGIVLVITIITLTSYFCNRVNLPNAPSHHGIPVPLTALSSDRGSATASFVKVGLDEATLRSYPILLYPQAKLLNKDADDSTTCCCSICLGDY
ncbi:RING-H2 finger protein ATL70 [Quillaja saponaria]|uniref:RING-H2 finger protein ATL70 n=1 Tax=Quillaja saponaria TaxID=32244 RepID=A0AAD7M6H2_QUISA|nr:RING-H2 finger protein ATL70 [Quillaja saponaria]